MFVSSPWPEVWSLLGPVEDEEVPPLFLDQSNLSFFSCTKPHVSESNLQEKAKENEAGNNQKRA